jgi:hypothetical protein
LHDALNATGARTNWTKEEISDIYNTPLIELQYAAVRFFHFTFTPPNWDASIIKHTSTSIELHADARYLGHCAPQVPLACRYPNVHSHEH